MIFLIISLILGMTGIVLELLSMTPKRRNKQMGNRLSEWGLIISAISNSLILGVILSYIIIF